MVDAPLFHSFIEDISSDVPSGWTPCCMLFYKTLEQEAMQAYCDMARCFADWKEVGALQHAILQLPERLDCVTQNSQLTPVQSTPSQLKVAGADWKLQ